MFDAAAPIRLRQENDLQALKARLHRHLIESIDEDRADIDAWTERAQQDFAAGKKANPEPNAQHAIAAACHKAVASVAAASERCHNGKKPKP